jgi:hypothetical protein
MSRYPAAFLIIIKSLIVREIGGAPSQVPINEKAPVRMRIIYARDGGGKIQ